MSNCSERVSKQRRVGSKSERKALASSYSDCTDLQSTDSNEGSAAAIKGTDAFLDKFIESRKILLTKMLPKSQANAPSAMLSAEITDSDANLPAFSEAELSSQSLWQLYLSTLPVDFFTSEEAQLLTNLSNRQSNSRLAYSGIALDEALLPDLQMFYENQVQPHVSRSQSVNSYLQFKVCLGQMARFSCSAEYCKPQDFCVAGSLFDLSTNEKLLRAFLLGMQTRCTATTIASKASHLLKWAHFSSFYFGREQQHREKAKCDLSIEYLRATASSEKREARRASRNNKNSINRLQGQKVLLLSDFERGQKHAEKSLLDLHNTLCTRFREEKAIRISDQKQIAFNIFASSDAVLLRKWCLNLLCALVLHGGGQRSQVYSELCLVAFGISKDGTVVDNLSAVEQSARETGYFYLQAKFEKRQRSSRMPYIRIPASLMHVYVAHVKYVRPALLKRVQQMCETDKPYIDPREDLLLLNTETGRPLNAKQVSATVKKFFKTLDPEIGNVTPLVIRRSYATIMYHKFLKGEIYKGKTRSQFLEYLAERLNTSLEQLEDVYCGDKDVEVLIERLFTDE